jgi:hypothetical protein
MKPFRARVRSTLPSALLLSAALVACSSSSGGSADGGTTVSAAQAASDGASAFCARAQACAPAYVQLEWGDVATCSTRFGAQLVGTLASTGTSDTPSQIEACAKALPTISCDDLLGNSTPAPCRAMPGSLANGAVCGDDSQCSGGHCKVPSQQTCGVCTTFAAAGASCTLDGDCDNGLTCFGGTCVTPVASGGACDTTSHPCLPTLACNAGTCGTPGAAGASCDPTATDTCDNLHGVFCDGATSKCVTAAFAQTGAPCGYVSGTLTICLAGPGNAEAECKGLSATSPTGTCQAPAADGASCNATTGPFCLAPSVCVNGACQLDDPSACH